MGRTKKYANDTERKAAQCQRQRDNREAINARERDKRARRGLEKRGPKRRYASERERMDAANARRRETRSNDPEYRQRATQYQRAFDERNAESERIRKRNWYKANPDTRRAQRQHRRSLERGAIGWHSARHIQAIRQLQGGACAYCQETQDLHIDHIQPLALGGSNWSWNLQMLCASHNISKGARTDAAYRQEIGLPPQMPLSQALWMIALGLF